MFSPDPEPIHLDQASVRKAPEKLPEPAAAVDLGCLLFPITVPLLLLAGAISIPVGFVQNALSRRREARFAADMDRVGRTILWRDAEDRIESGHGVLIGEWLGLKGPLRIWWTEEEVESAMPSLVDRSMDLRFPFEPEHYRFNEWCYREHTHPETGRAQLVSIPRGLENQVDGRLAELRKSGRLVEFCSHPEARSPQAEDGLEGD